MYPHTWLSIFKIYLLLLFMYHIHTSVTLHAHVCIDVPEAREYWIPRNWSYSSL